MIHFAWMLAQEGGAEPQQTPQQAPASVFFLPALFLAMLVFLFMSQRSQRKREQREREQMLGRLSKSDRVLTIGGVIGTVMAVKEDEVVLKVDESTNTKMTFLKSSIQRILTDEPAPTS